MIRRRHVVTVKEQIHLPCASKIWLESISLWRMTFQSDTLPALRCVPDIHAPIAKYLDIDDSVADLKLSVAIANLNLQIAVKAAGATCVACSSPSLLLPIKISFNTDPLSKWRQERTHSVKLQIFT